MRSHDKNRKCQDALKTAASPFPHRCILNFAFVHCKRLKVKGKVKFGSNNPFTQR